MPATAKKKTVLDDYGYDDTDDYDHIYDGATDETDHIYMSKYKHLPTFEAMLRCFTPLLAVLLVEEDDLLRFALLFFGSTWEGDAVRDARRQQARQLTLVRSRHAAEQHGLAFGYGRLEGIASAESLARLYSSSRFFVNFFQPSFKLIRKERIGARVRKHYAPPETPCSRLLGHSAIAETTKEKLRAVLASLDPLRMLDEIRTMQRHIAGLARGETAHTPPHRNADLDRFLASLATAWLEGEARPTHKPKAKGDRWWRTREDPFEDAWPKILVWLQSEPDCTARELFERLRAEHPNSFGEGQLRTLQRRVKAWRAAAARKLVFSEELCIEAAVAR